MTEPDRIFVLSFNEDGDPPRVSVFGSRAHFEQWINDNGINPVSVKSPVEVTETDCFVGHLVVEGHPIKIVPKRTITEWKVEG